MKTLMTDKVCRADWEISTLMCKTGGSDHTRSSNELKFWNNSFNGLKFLNNHLNATENVNKVKTTGRQKLAQNVTSYLMRCAIISRGLFEASDESEQNEIKLSQEVTQLREHQKAQAVRLSDLEKKLQEEKTKREKLEAMNQELKSIINQQSKKMKSLQHSNFHLQSYL